MMVGRSILQVTRMISVKKVICSQESPKREASVKDFDWWDLNRFVEYRSPFTRNRDTLPIKKPI